MTTVKMVKLGTLIKPAKLQKCGNDDYPVLSMTMHNGLVFQSDKFKKSKLLAELFAQNACILAENRSK